MVGGGLAMNCYGHAIREVPEESSTVTMHQVNDSFGNTATAEVREVPRTVYVVRKLSALP